ncbi:MAG: RIP metalloprotease RseP [Betaproteobacteria bacterium TMED41]|nr:MAG: RIP metalloprotease RseP [Betaproteobacteria bacterium TMED41]|tara:strand:+ start:458 stop:1822 length:1365 start_codon:yes stop_codon:yes gene_type:complete
MIAIISFIVAITALVFVHEFGHYIVARFYGVKVIRFSIGFGTPLLSKTDSHGTEWVLSAIPLGGYVTMWDHLNSKLTSKHHDFEKSYSNKSIFARSAIVIGGPLANFIFAILAYTCIYSLENYKTMPIIDTPEFGSIAQRNGLKKNDKIIRINKLEIDSFEKIDSYVNEIFNKSDLTSPLIIEFLRDDKNLKNVNLNISNLKIDKSENLTKKIGLLPRSKGVKIIDVLDNSLAQEFGLSKGDIILSIDGEEVNFPSQVTDIIKLNKKKSLEIQYVASPVLPYSNMDQNLGNKMNTANVIFDHSKQVLGVYLMANTHKFISSMSLVDALKNGISQTFKVIDLCIDGIYKLFTSGSPFENIGGPISIANAAENSANSGILPFVAFLALLSVSIGVINLLPIPILDGGHLLYHIIELIKGEPLSPSFKLIGTWCGLFFIVGLTILAVSNDILRFLTL